MTTRTRDGKHLIDPNGGFLETLKRCKGHYVCPIGPDGKLFGPVVGYTAPYDAGDGTKKNWVGLEYFNFAKADSWPAVLTFFAEDIDRQLREMGTVPDVIVGAPWAGVKFSQEVARLTGCRHVFAEKDVIGFDSDRKKIEKLILGRYEGEIEPGDKVLIGEELVNNASTTGKLINLIEDAGGKVIGIICAINRSYPFRDTFRVTPERNPVFIFGVINRSTPQYKQDNPIVAADIEAGNIVWKPKYAWDQMKTAMDTYD